MQFHNLMQSNLLLGSEDYFTENINTMKAFWAISNNLGCEITCTVSHVQSPFIEDDHQGSLENGLSRLEDS